MLQTLFIKNLALINELTLDFSNGLSVLVGETGAGKSLILSALAFVFGGKSDKGLIRTSTTSLKVEGKLINLNKNTIDFLNNSGIEFEDEIIICRSLSIEGKSDCRINGSLVPVSTLKALSEFNLDFYGQHDSVVILNKQNHMSILDSFMPENIDKLKTEIDKLLVKKRDINHQVNVINGDGFSFEKKKDYLQYQISEIESIAPLKNEDIELSEKRTLMLSFEKTLIQLNDVVSILNGQGGGSLDSQANSAKKILNSLSNYSKEFVDLKERMQTIEYELVDIEETLSTFKKNFVFDEYEFNKIDSRYEKIKNLKQKYGPSLDNVIKHLELSKNELFLLENSEELLTKLAKEEAIISIDLNKFSEELSIERKKVSEILEEKLIYELKALGIKNANFKVAFEKNEAVITKNGFDSIEFLFSANKGEPLKSLAKTISGGELSRFMLVFKNIVAAKGGVSILVFDEIDTGISGETAAVVAIKLANLAKQFQVFCITHLPQVASISNNLIYVYKNNDLGQTTTQIKHLDYDEKAFEISKMFATSTNSVNALNHAKDLLEWAKAFN